MATISRLNKIKPLMYLAVILGSVIVAFGNTVFLTPLDINSGGLNGIGIIIMNFCSESTKMLAYNIVIYAFSIALWVIGLIFIGKDFALKTLVSTIVFPFATSLFTVIPGTKDFANGITKILLDYSAEPTIGTFMLFAIGSFPFERYTMILPMLWLGLVFWISIISRVFKFIGMVIRKIKFGQAKHEEKQKTE